MKGFRFSWLPILILGLSPAPTTAAGPETQTSISLAFVGDIMLGRGVKRITDTAGLFYPFQPTYRLLKSASLAIGNLESPLTTAEYLTPSPWKFKGDTSAAAAELHRAGFRFLALANNHAPDCGPDGFFDTQRFLNQAGIGWSGRGDSFLLRNPADPRDDSLLRSYCLPAFGEIAGLRIGFLSFCAPYLLEISRNYGGNLIARADSATVVNSIQLIKDRCDLIICSFHWGQEYQDRPESEQKKLGRLAIRSGAHIVHGHHPHVLQGVEFYRGGIIAYSLGNFIFDQRHTKPRQSGLLVVPISLSENGPAREILIDSVSFIPLEIVKNRPQPANRQAKEILKRMTKLCRRLGTAALTREQRLYLYPEEKKGRTKKPD